MNGFVVVAGLLTLAVLVALLFPLLRRRADSPEAWQSGGIAGLLILIGAATLYPLWSNYKWNEPEPAADSPQAMVGRLARRLERNPDDLNGWLMLGRSYAVIADMDQQAPARWHELAVRAYQRADTLAKGKNAEAHIGLAEALLETGRSDLTGRAGRLFEEALKLDESSTKAWFYGALAALERNELPLARERFERLLRANPPQQVVQIIQQQLQLIDAQQAMTATAPDQGAGSSPSTPASAAAAVGIPLRITLAAALVKEYPAGARLFIVARSPGQRMPLAVRPLEVKFPQDVQLLSTDSMTGGNGFAAGQELEIEARIALSGGANSRSGDPFGVIRLRAGARERSSIEINQIRP